MGAGGGGSALRRILRGSAAARSTCLSASVFILPHHTRTQSAPQGCPEKSVFDAVMLWAGYGAEVDGPAAACHPMQDLDQLLPCIRFPLMLDEELEAVG